MANEPRYGRRTTLMVSTCLLICFCAPFALAVPSPQSCEPNCRPGAADYHAVMDALFPLEWHENFYLVLRYAPPWEPESQIVILRKEDESFEVHFYSLAKGSERIGNQVLRWRAEHPNEALGSFTKSVKIEHKTVHVNPKAMSRIMASFDALRIAPKLSPDVVVDGTAYEFWFVAFSSCHVMHITLSDADFGHDSTAHPLVRWMNNVRRMVETTELNH